jgi:hypothetical protein
MRGQATQPRWCCRFQPPARFATPPCPLLSLQVVAVDASVQPPSYTIAIDGGLRETEAAAALSPATVLDKTALSAGGTLWFNQSPFSDCLYVLGSNCTV